MQELEARGFFSDEGDDGTQVPIGQKTELGALKRAQVRLARARPDIVYSLAEDKVARIAAAPLPFPDRKARLAPVLRTRTSCALMNCRFHSEACAASPGAKHSSLAACCSVLHVCLFLAVTWPVSSLLCEVFLCLHNMYGVTYRR